MRRELKALIKRTPGLRAIARMAERGLGRWGSPSFDSSEYWKARYLSGGNSGPGSYDRLAQFKAEILNEFVRRHSIASVIEFGSGNGAQLKLANYPSYVGVDLAPTAIEQARTLFPGDRTKTFMQLDEYRADQVAELGLSLDVVYHLVEDQKFHAHMMQLFDAAQRYAIIYASNFDRRDAAHVRHRRFTDWIESNRSDFVLIETIKNPYAWNPANSDQTSFADFYVYERRANTSR